jgi:hypothetical protein
MLKKAKTVSLAQLIHSTVAYHQGLNPGSEQCKSLEKIAKSFLFVQLWKALKTCDFKQLASLIETMKGNKLPFCEYLRQSDTIAKFLLDENAVGKIEQRRAEIAEYFRKEFDNIKEPALMVASFMGETYHMPNKTFIKYVGNGKNSSYLSEGNTLPESIHNEYVKNICVEEYERIITMAVENILTHSVLKKVKLQDNWVVTAYTRDNINIKDVRVFDNETQEFRNVTLNCSAVIVPDGSLHIFSISYNNFVIHSKNNSNTIQNQVGIVDDTQRVNKEGQKKVQNSCTSPNLLELDHLFPEIDNSNITSVDDVDLFETFMGESIVEGTFLDYDISGLDTIT